MKPKKAELARFAKLQALGCLCCRKAGSGYRAPDIHHILSGGRRIGHMATIGLCEFHHRIPSNGTVVGPSLADGSKRFEAHWGTQRELLAEVDLIIGSGK
jgi:hypothetical protein